MGQHILVVDDDALMRRSLGLHLEQAGFRTSTSASAEDALALARRDRPDLILLDMGLPGMDGLDALRHFKASFGPDADVPVIFVTARRRELDTVLGLELGADDYITKPFNPDVLLARVKAVLRRSQSSLADAGARMSAPATGAPARLTLGDLVIEPATHTVTVAGRPVDLTAKEFDLLHALALEGGRILSIDQLIARVWGAEFEGESQAVYVHVRWLREKMEENPNNPQRIVNVRGKGYRLVPQG